MENELNIEKLLAAHEAETMGERCGLDYAAMRQVLAASSAQSFVGEHWLERFKRIEDPMPIRKRRTEVFQKSLASSMTSRVRL